MPIRKEKFERIKAAVLPIMAGLLIAQIISTAQVYLSNLRVLQTGMALNAAGYLTVPNEKVMAGLNGFGPAFFGGLFFTLTIGLFLTLAAFFCGRIAGQLKGTGRGIFMAALVLLLLWPIVSVNLDGFSPMTTLYFLMVPTVVFGLSALHRPQVQEEEGNRWGFLVHPVCLVLLGIIFYTQIEAKTYSRFRDEIMLSNRAGIGITNFYYQYTLYPAEVFKSPEQRMIRTVRLTLGDRTLDQNLDQIQDQIQDKTLKDRLEKVLARYDYLPLQNWRLVDLTLEISDKDLVGKTREGTVQLIPLTDFWENPKKSLEKMLAGTDRHQFFRSFTFLSLIAVTGLFFYLLLYIPAHLLFLFFLQGAKREMAAALFCLLAGAGLIFALKGLDRPVMDKEEIQQALLSEETEARIDALKAVAAKRLDLADFPAHVRLEKSPVLLVRYWLAKALGGRGSDATLPVLLRLLDDPQPTVRYNAAASLGKRKDRAAADPILNRLGNSNHWYVQLYLYKALKRIGWRQSPLG